MLTIPPYLRHPPHTSDDAAAARSPPVTTSLVVDFDEQCARL